ncbi:hypothetical protein JCM8547_000247 [Rhodosporidiobolus lusitaniae]
MYPTVDDREVWHYQSQIPFPGTTHQARRTSFSPPTLQHSVFIQDYPSPREWAPEQDYPAHLSPRPEQPDVPRTPQLNTTPQISSLCDAFHPSFPSGGGGGGGLLPSLATSPPRPRRPTHPEHALMFASPAYVSNNTSSGSDSSPNPLSSFPHPPAPVSPTTSPQLAAPSSPRPPSHQSSRRKPVPKFIPDARPASPIVFRSSSPPLSSPPPPHLPPHLGSPGRLSVGDFKALVARGSADPSSPPVTPHLEQGEHDEEEGQVVWSPRIHLGLDDAGVVARERRLQRDRDVTRASQQILHERDLGDRLGLVEVEVEQEADETIRPTTKRATFDNAPPPGVGGVEPRTPPRAGANGTNRETGSIRRFLTPKSARSKRSRVTSYDPQYDDRLSEGEDVVVEEKEKGPVLRRGSKRLSELPSASEGEEEDEKEEVERERGSNSGGSASWKEMLKAKKGRKTNDRPLRERGISNRSVEAAAEEEKARRRGRNRSREVEVVVHDSKHDTTTTEGSETDEGTYGWDGAVAPGNPGDWERIRRETTCRPERMNWSMVDFEGWFPRLLHLLYPICILAHVPFTLFLDYNLLYLLIQLALYPALPSSILTNLSTRALVGVPSIQASTGWYVALGIYAACTGIWFFFVFVWREIGRDFVGNWSAGGRPVAIEKIYSGAASYNLACIRSYSVFSFLWRVRLAPFRSNSPLAVAVEGSRFSDGIKETFSWYRQNWPTVLLLIPRAGLSVAILFLYNTTDYGSLTANSISRNSAYFVSNGTLSPFAFGVLMANAVWAAWRLFLVLFSAFALWVVDRPAIFRPKFDPYFHPSRSHLTISSPMPLLSDKSPAFTSPSTTSRRRSSVSLSTWRTRRQRRLRAAILACLGSTPLSSTSATFSPFLSSPYILGHSPSSRNKSTFSPVVGISPANRDEQERRSHLERHGRNGPQGIVVESESGPMMSSPRPVHGLWGSASRFVLPQPKLPTSPLIHFSPATPETAQFSGQFPSNNDGQGYPRRMSVATGVEATGGDLGESQLHRRNRSLPARQDDVGVQDHPAIIRFDAVSPPSLPYLPTKQRSPAPHPSSFLSPRPAPYAIPSSSSSSSSVDEGYKSSSTHAHVMPPTPRPNLVSHFSAFSSKPSSVGQPSPTVEYLPPFPWRQQSHHSTSMSRQTTSSSFASPGPILPSFPQASPSSLSPPSIRDPTPAALSLVSSLNSRLASQTFSAQLLDEVQKLHEAEEALAREEARHRVMGLKRISEMSSSGGSQGQQSFTTAPTAGTVGGARTTAEEEMETDEEFATATDGGSGPDSRGTQSTSSSRPLSQHVQPPVAVAPETTGGRADPRRLSALSSTSAWSRPYSVGGLSESSTLRGAVRSARHSGEGHQDDKDEDGERGEPNVNNLDPFRLSYGSGADRLSLSAYGSPVIGGPEEGEEGEQEGEKEEAPPVPDKDV